MGSSHVIGRTRRRKCLGSKSVSVEGRSFQKIIYSAQDIAKRVASIGAEITNAYPPDADLLLLDYCLIVLTLYLYFLN